ncbi:TFB2M transferase, partial [Polypterus senegalus]
MMTHSSRQLVLAFKSCFCQTCGCPPFKAHTLLRPYSIEIPSVVGRTKKTQEKLKLEKSTSLQGLTQRNLSAVAGLLKGQYRPLSRFDFLDFGDLEEHTLKALACSSLRRFIINPDLAGLIAEKLDKDLSENHAVIFECNPGPGVLTLALFNAGAQRIVALESDKTFLSGLQELERRLEGQLDVMYCDFFRLDPIGRGLPKPPIMHSEKLFNDLGISEVPWIADIPIKVVGIFSQRNERNMLWRLIYALFECLSIFRYGRVEMNVFISENEYTKLTAQPGNMRHYQALSVLWQVACDIEVLHKEPWSSFVTSSKHSGLPKSMGCQGQRPGRDAIRDRKRVRAHPGSRGGRLPGCSGGHGYRAWKLHPVGASGHRQEVPQCFGDLLPQHFRHTRKSWGEDLGRHPESCREDSWHFHHAGAWPEEECQEHLGLIRGLFKRGRLLSFSAGVGWKEDKAEEVWRRPEEGICGQD